MLSLHALIALAGGRPIVTTAWLHQSIDGGAAMPVRSLLLEDFQAEKKHKFIMKSSYDAARSKKLLQGACTVTLANFLVQCSARVRIPVVCFSFDHVLQYTRCNTCIVAVAVPWGSREHLCQLCEKGMQAACAV